MRIVTYCDTCGREIAIDNSWHCPGCECYLCIDCHNVEGDCKCIKQEEKEFEWECLKSEMIHEG